MGLLYRAKCGPDQKRGWCNKLENLVNVAVFRRFSAIIRPVQVHSIVPNLALIDEGVDTVGAET